MKPHEGDREAEADKGILDRIRLKGELELLQLIFKQFDLAKVLQHVSNKEVRHASRWMSARRISDVRLNDRLAPRVMGVLAEVTERLEIPFSVELYVEPDASINASAHWPLDTKAPRVMSVTSGALISLNDGELAYLFGHELGHHYYRHHRDSDVDLALDEGLEEYPLLQRRLKSWSRLAELSADRAGAQAVDCDFDVVLSAMTRFTTGLGPEDLQIDMSALHKEIGHIKALDVGEHLHEESHPLLPLRARAVQLFCDLENGSSSPKRAYEVEQETLALARMMDFEVHGDEQVHERDFLLAGGLILSHLDGDEDLPEEDRTALVELIGGFSSDPEAHLKRISTLDQAQGMLTKASAWISENAGPERYGHFSKLVDIAVRDKVVDPLEREFLIEVAHRIGIPETFVDRELERAVGALARSRAEITPRPFGLQF